MANEETVVRRQFIVSAAGISAGLILGPHAAHAKKPASAKQQPEEDVSPIEDLMREHGILRRLVLVYREVIHRIETNAEVKPDLIAQAAQIIRAFVEDYHERDEEEFIFPRFKKAGKLTDLVDTLLQQHQAGRRLTANIQRLATASGIGSTSGRQEMARTMSEFIRMYEPHAAREDTVLFPAFDQLIGEKELHKLQELFEQKEQALPTGNFEKMVAEVEKLEQSLGIYDLAQFTAKS